MPRKKRKFNFTRLTRKRARRLGLKRYFTGEPCGHGHLSERYTDSYQCVECIRLRNKHINTKKRNTARKLERSLRDFPDSLAYVRYHLRGAFIWYEAPEKRGMLEMAEDVIAREQKIEEN